MPWSLDLLHAQRTLLLGATVTLLSLSLMLGCWRASRRRDRRSVRLRVVPYRGEDATAESIVAMFEALHKRLLVRWWRRLLGGQPSIALEAHISEQAWLAVCCPAGSEQMVLSALRCAYPNCRLERAIARVGAPPALLRLKKEQLFIKRVKAIDRFAHEREPFMNRLLRTLQAGGEPAFVQLAMTPAHIGFERHAKRLYKRHEHRLSRERGDGLLEPRLDRSMVEEAELRGGLRVQHRPLFFVDVRVVAADRSGCERIASALRAEVAENRLVERGTVVRHGLLGLYRARVIRGEANPLASTRKGVFASTELAAMWHLPSLDFLAVPLQRSSVPVAPAPAAILRPADGLGTLRDARGPVSIHPELRRQNTAVVGAVEQGKSSYLVASFVEDLTRSKCAVILLDPKGDAAEAALSNVPPERVCTLLDFARPIWGFDPLALDAPAEAIADHVDFERVIRREEVLVVKGALGSIGAGNTSVLMHLLLGMLDAALSRRQDPVTAKGRVAVALKIDEAPLVLDGSFAETMALKRSTGLETVACWQANAQWVERKVRDQLDALFAHRVYFATAAIADARESARMTMAQFSDGVRPRTERLSALGRPDVRLHLPRHHAIASWSTPAGRQLPFIGQTIPLRVDRDRLAWHAARQREREGER